MKNYLLTLMKQLEALVPPPPRCHHAIMYSQFGSDADGWEDKLTVQVNMNGQFHAVFLDAGDFQKSAVELAEAIADSLAEPMPNAQIGVGLGQFI